MSKIVEEWEQIAQRRKEEKLAQMERNLEPIYEVVTIHLNETQVKYSTREPIQLYAWLEHMVGPGLRFYVRKFQPVIRLEPARLSDEDWKKCEQLGARPLSV